MELLGLVGYSIAALTYFLYVLLLLAARNNTLQGKLALSAALIMSLSSLYAAGQIEFHLDLKFVLFAEIFKLAAWSTLILSAKEKTSGIKALFKQPHIIKFYSLLICASAFAWFSAVYFDAEYKYVFLVLLAGNLLLLVMLEQFFRNTDSVARTSTWPLVIAVGGIATFDFIMFAQAVMVKQLDFDFWYARGFVYTLLIPFLLMSTRRMKDWSVNIYVSREIVFYSSMMLILGGYLLVMALAGYAINYFGGQWSDLLSIGFLFLGGSVLVALLITDSLRRKVKVLISKHFFANKYDYREEWLKLIERLESNSDNNSYQTAVEIFKSSFGIETGAIAKKIHTGVFKFVYNDGLVITDSLRKPLTNIEKFNVEHNWIIDVEEYRAQPGVYKNLELNAQQLLQTRTRIIVPIYVNKALFGYFLLSEMKEGGRINWEDRDLMFAIAKQLGNFISLNEANLKLAESKQFDAFNRMSAFLVHDLKNVQAQLALINTNAKRHRDNPEFVDDVFETVDSASTRLGKVLHQLRNKQMAHKENKEVSISHLLEKVVAQRNVAQPQVSIVEVDNTQLVIDDETLHSVLNHLIQNAQEATKKDGWVKVKACGIDGNLHIAITDNGCGMSEEFIANRLFVPFDTTKGNAGMGIGVYEAKQFIEGLGGSMQVASFEGKGSSFNLSIPILN